METKTDNISIDSFGENRTKTKQNVNLMDKTRFSCRYCDKNFISPSELKRHEKTHTGEKTFICEVCGKGYTQAGHLKTHEKLHSGEKQFHCDNCDQAFSGSGQLKEHKRIHTGPGQRPYRVNKIKYFHFDC